MKQRVKKNENSQSCLTRTVHAVYPATQHHACLTGIPLLYDRPYIKFYITHRFFLFIKKKNEKMYNVAHNINFYLIIKFTESVNNFIYYLLHK